MTRMGKLGEWDEAAFQEALLRFDPEMRAIVEASMRENRELLCKLARM